MPSATDQRNQSDPGYRITVRGADPAWPRFGHRDPAAISDPVEAVSSGSIAGVQNSASRFGPPGSEMLLDSVQPGAPDSAHPGHQRSAHSGGGDLASRVSMVPAQPGAGHFGPAGMGDSARPACETRPSRHVRLGPAGPGVSRTGLHQHRPGSLSSVFPFIPHLFNSRLSLLLS